MSWGSDYWLSIVCFVAVITGLLLFVVVSDYWFGIVCGGAVITGLVLCVVWE